MSEETMYREAVEAISKGQRDRARDLFTRLLKTNQSSSQYWLWMSSLVDSDRERIYCLETVLRLDAENQAAKRGLILLGARQPDETIKPVPPVRRKWAAAFSEEQEEPKTLFQKLILNPVARGTVFLAVGILIFGLILYGAFGMRPDKEAIVIHRVTITVPINLTYTATPTLLPTSTLVVKSPTPTFVGATPLWMFLEATYTPVPPYVNTPHPVNEAYRAAMRSFNKGDARTMLRFIQQAADYEPQSADIQYYLGEALRLNEDFEAAISAYEDSIKLDPSFAPAFLGRGRARLSLDSPEEAIADFERALELDPNMIDTYLELARIYIEKGEAEAAMEALQSAQTLSPETPRLHVYFAQTQMMLGENETALQTAQHALELDQTLLPAYQTLGQAYLVNQEPGEALQYLKTYVLYEDTDATGFVLLGQAYLEEGKNLEAAMKALDQALKFDEQLFAGYYYRGLANIALEEGRAAVNDLSAALRLDAGSFSASLHLGRALLADGRPNEAYRQLQAAEALAETDEHYALLYYWRALALETLGNPRAAVYDWEALLELPEEAVPGQWLRTARRHLLELNPPTETASPSPTPSSTSRPTRKPTATSTPTTMPTKTQTPFPAPSSTPAVTRTPRPSRTPTPANTPRRSPTPTPTRLAPSATPRRSPTPTQTR